MPSTVMIAASGGIGLVQSGLGYALSGTAMAVIGGLQLRYDVSGPGVVHVRLPNLSGNVVTVSSGVSGVVNWTDGVPLGRGDSYFVPNSRLISGLESVRVGVPADASGGFMFWEIM